MADVEYVECAEGDHGLAGHVNCSLSIAPLHPRIAPANPKGSAAKRSRPLADCNVAYALTAETCVHVGCTRFA
jgi:hypothetical protein